jgi:hypothetical protein
VQPDIANDPKNFVNRIVFKVESSQNLSDALIVIQTPLGYLHSPNLPPVFVAKVRSEVKSLNPIRLVLPVLHLSHNRFWNRALEAA